MYVCVCKAVTEREIEQAVAEGVCSMPGLRLKLGVATRCCKCAPMAQRTMLHKLADMTHDEAEDGQAAIPVQRWESSA